MEDDQKTIIESLGKAFEEFKAAHSAEIAELKKKGTADVVTTEKLARIDDVVAKLAEAKDAIIARQDALEKKGNRPGLGHNGGPTLEEEAAEFKKHVAAWDVKGRAPEITAVSLKDYKAAFDTYLRKGAQSLDRDEFKAMSVGGDPDGGYLVNADRTGRIVTRVFDLSPIRQIAAVQAISTDALEGLRDTDEMGSGWVGETAARPVTTTAQVGTWRIPTHEVYAQPDVTQKLLDDASVDIEAWIAMKVADRFARREGNAFIVGDGVTQPRGFTTYTTAATSDASRAWGTLEHVGTGTNGAFASSNPADVFFDLIGAFKDAYLVNARFVTRREIIALIRKFKGVTNDYLWQPGLTQGQPQTILGFPVTVAQDMPALATNSLSLAFGDFQTAYQIVDRVGIRTLRDPYSAKPYVRFYSTKRVGGDVVQFEALKFIRFA